MALWHSTLSTHKEKQYQSIQTFHNKVLRNNVNMTWYVHNKNIHQDLKVPLVTDEIKRFAVKHVKRLQGYPNDEMS